MNRENGRELSWLVERWASALTAALNEAGVAVTAEWRPRQQMTAADAESWWTRPLATAAASAISLGFGAEARRVLADAPVPAVIERGAAIFEGAPSPARFEAAAMPAEGTVYAIRFRGEAGPEFEVAAVFREPEAATVEAPGSPATVRDRMGMLLKVEVPVTISLGRAQMALKDALKLTRGSVVELDRSFSELADVVVNGRVVARGDIVVVEEKYAVRIREIYRDESNQLWPAMAPAALR